jgi:CP family cyanate transporter-like MFS transporter
VGIIFVVISLGATAFGLGAGRNLLVGARSERI